MTRGTAAGLGAIATVAVPALLPHVLHGGFMADDWVDNGQYLYHPGSGFWDAVRYSQDAPRDAWGYLRMSNYALFGTHPWAHLTVTAVASLAECGLFFLLARRLRVPAAPAAMAAVLLLLFPFADSTRLWASGAQMSIFAGCCFFGGLLVALRGLDVGGRRGIALHGAALLLYALSVNGYELAAPLILLAGLLYTREAGWRAARWRWAADVVVVAAVLIRYSGRHAPVPGLSLGDLLSNAYDIGRSGVRVAARSVVPASGIEARQVLAGVAVIVVAALVVSWRARRGSAVRREVRLGLALLGLGIVLGAAGWTMFLTGYNGYSPEWPGFTNRVNAAAVFGIVIGIGAIALLVAALLRAALRERAPSATLLVTLLLVPVALAYYDHFRSDASAWDRAGRENRALLDRLHALVPAPAPGTTLFTVKAHGYAAPAVIVFGGQDLYWAAKVRYRNPNVTAFPVLNGMRFTCAATTMGLDGTNPPSATRYGRAVLVNIPAGVVIRPRDRSDCLRQIEQLKPYSPDYPVG